MTTPTDPLENLGRRSALAVAERRATSDREAEIAAVARRAGRPRRLRIAAVAVAVLVAAPLAVSQLRTPPRDIQFAPAPGPAPWVEVGRNVFNGTEPPPETRPLEGTFAAGVSGVAVAGDTIVAVGLDPDPEPEQTPARPAAWTSQDGRTWDRGGVDDGGAAYAEAGLLMEDVVPVTIRGEQRLVAVGYADFEPETGPVTWQSSDNGTTWELMPVGGTGVMTSVTVTPTGLVAVGSDADEPAAWTSATGHRWVRAQVETSVYPTASTLTDVAASGGRVVAVGHYGLGESGLWVSEDGATWELTGPPHIIDAQLDLRSVTATSAGGFLAAGSLSVSGEQDSDGAVFESADGRTWERTSTPAPAGTPGAQFLSTAVEAPGGRMVLGSDQDRATIWSAVGDEWEVVFTDDTVPDAGFSSADELFATPAGLLVTGIATAQGPQEARVWLRPAADGEVTPPAPVEIIDQPIGTFGGATPLGPVTSNGVIVTAEGYGSGVITATDASGAELWTYDLHESAFLGPVAGETLLAASHFGQVVALDIRSGSQRWSLGRHLDVVESPGVPAVEDGVVYLPTSYTIEGDTAAPRLHAVDLATGAVRWTRNLEPGTDLQWAPPVVADDLVLVADTFSHPRSAPTSWLHALDRGTGERVWRFDLETRRQAFNDYPPLVRNGRVFVSAFKGPLFAIDLGTGEQLWRRPADEEPRALRLDGDALIVELNGREHRVDVSNGAVLD